MSSAFSAGQELFFEPVTTSLARRDVSPTVHPVTVSKVGRAWVTFAHGRQSMRFELEPDDDGLFYVDGGDYSSPGRVWLTREAHADHLARMKAGETILAATRRGGPVFPPQVPTEMLVALAALLPPQT